MLYQLGSVQFEVAPVNVHEVSHEVGADFAAKDIVGAAREFADVIQHEAGMAAKPKHAAKIFPPFTGRALAVRGNLMKKAGELVFEDGNGKSVCRKRIRDRP
jgi:hypothetical protein